LHDLGSAGQITPVQIGGIATLARDDPPAPDEARTVVPPEGIPAPPVLLLAVVPPLEREPATADAPPLGREELVREAVIEAPPEGIAVAPPEGRVVALPEKIVGAPPEGIAEAPPEGIAEALAPPAAPAVPPKGVGESPSPKSVVVMSERIPHPANSKAMMDVTRREKVLLSMD
jgi:hypothetical protein